MKVSVQTSELRLLREAVRSGCSGVRFGSEFCEHLLPSLRTLEKAHALASENGKQFTYATPILSNAGIDKLREQLSALDERGEISIVVNDFGALNMLSRYPNLHPQLGRNLFLVPARSPWTDAIIQRRESSTQMGDWLRDLYSTTSLNSQATIELYRSYGCQSADVDWIPRILSSLGFLVQNGLSLSVHLLLVPVTFTRKCHMARFLGEKSPETCSRPCVRRGFVLKNEVLRENKVDFFLSGNTVFMLVQPLPGDTRNLERVGVSEIVLTMNPITRLDTAPAIDHLISDIMGSCPGAS